MVDQSGDRSGWLISSGPHEVTQLEQEGLDVHVLELGDLTTGRFTPVD